ncbi:ankyrin repeat-containing protein At5g02620-like [Phoenix dactylifera]|uniref:Ankyrin repeat-containing protein At5g02620-like n=1 Tax=Phoenix dactylifera TaxID=42345 RepID=A0A8B7CVG1_PHODC|nr:ankyrin repeat-containing protein At5g02620-like [Phoenix dactylifera]XP_008807258.2 ankyrin repeat-containing protein At5g02620-like [Phoenix dactylifera]XP_008807259.2 ankyrin repeat-containing protein At5g02620-like [Phoenix dactylifera]XP_008807260.2 ankyrin repeat-containing protein At5g02620-like [Phoenix dactylifera]
MEKQQSVHHGALEKLQSFRLEAMEKQKSFRMGSMEKQKSFRLGSMDKQQSFKERRYRDSPGKRGDTPLHLASRAGNVVHVQRILSDCNESHLKDLISKQNQDGETMLYVAAEKGHVEVVREILKVSDFQSASTMANNSFDAFHIAAKQGHLEILKELLQSFPALAMTTNLLNSTALDTAATQGHLDVVNLLLETDANLTKIARNNGKTVLHSAARMGHVEVVKSLLNKDPSVGLRTDKKGQTAFHMAVKGQNVDIVQELLKPDISIIHLEDNKGNRPLHIATRKGNLGIVQALLSVEGIDVNAINRAGETALGIAEKCCNEQISAILREFGAVTSKEQANPLNPAKQLKQTVSDIKHDVQSQLRQTHQTEMRVQKIKKRLQKLHIGGLNNAINSNTVVAVLIATVAFAAIFTVPGQFVDTSTKGYTLGQAYVAKKAAFIIFLVFDSLALFISLAVVVVQTSLIVVEQKAKKMMVFVMNKLMWLACLFISASFISLTYVVVGHDWWLAWSTMAIGASIMLTTLGSMCYFIIVHRFEEKTLRNIRRASASRSHSWSLSVASDSEILNSEYKKLYAI